MTTGAQQPKEPVDGELFKKLGMEWYAAGLIQMVNGKVRLTLKGALFIQVMLQTNTIIDIATVVATGVRSGIAEAQVDSTMNAIVKQYAREFVEGQKEPKEDGEGGDAGEAAKEAGAGDAPGE